MAARFRIDLVHQHLHLVRAIARRVRRELDGHVEIEDLEGHGMEGLVQAAARFDRRRGASFATFAAYRIRGAMYDAVRALGRYSRREVAEHRAAAALTAQPLPSDPDAVAGDAPPADEIAAARERRRQLHDAVARLPGQESQVIRKVYFEDKMLTDAGAELGLSKSWSSRLHARAVDRLREMLAGT
jgi:RNA polymerase sigma factor FliA